MLVVGGSVASAEGVVQELRVFGLVRRGAVVFIIMMVMMIL